MREWKLTAKPRALSRGEGELVFEIVLRCLKIEFASRCRTRALRLAAHDGPAVIRLAKPRGLGIFFGAEPAIRVGDGGITPACLHVIDPNVTRHMRAHGKLGLDAAVGRHRRL